MAGYDYWSLGDMPFMNDLHPAECPQLQRQEYPKRREVTRHTANFIVSSASEERHMEALSVQIGDDAGSEC
jgi:hypothetical protein